MKNLPGGAWAHTPRKDLALLQISETRFYGEKVVWAMLGLIMPPLLAGFFSLIGLPLPFAIPTLGSLALAALFWFMPNYNAADDATRSEERRVGKACVSKGRAGWSEVNYKKKNQI